MYNQKGAIVSIYSMTTFLCMVGNKGYRGIANGTNVIEA